MDNNFWISAAIAAVVGGAWLFTDESAFRNDVERIVRRIDRLISETKSRLS